MNDTNFHQVHEAYTCFSRSNCLFIVASDSIWSQRFDSALVQLMACCLIAQSHYLNQCWLLINEVVFRWEHASSLWVPKLLISLITVKNILSKLLPHLPGANELKTISMLAVLKLAYFKKSKSMSWLSAVMILTEEENMILIIHLKECQLPQCQEII